MYQEENNEIISRNEMLKSNLFSFFMKCRLCVSLPVCYHYTPSLFPPPPHFRERLYIQRPLPFVLKFLIMYFVKRPLPPTSFVELKVVFNRHFLPFNSKLKDSPCILVVNF